MHFLLNLIPLPVVGLMIAGMWKEFVKAELPGWWALLPGFNALGLIRIADDPGWTLVLLLVPIVNLVFLIHLYSPKVAAFGKGFGYCLGLISLPFIFFPILGFGSAPFKAPNTRGT